MSHSASMTMAARGAAVLGAVWLTAWSPSAQSTPAAGPRPRVAVFFEAGFPAVDVEAIPEAALREALAGLDVDLLPAAGSRPTWPGAATTSS